MNGALALAVAWLCAATLWPANAGAEQWIQHGLRLTTTVEPPPAPINAQRVKSQIGAACGGGDISYASSAAMRGALPQIDWSRHVRRLASSAAMLDDYAEADAALQAALSEPGLSDIATNVLENQRIALALQFDRPNAALDLLARYGLPAGLNPALRSDRLYWEVLATAQSGNAAPAHWHEIWLPRLDQAFASDPSSFQVRVWRVIAWLYGAAPQSGRTCRGDLVRYSDILLDATEVASCPLFLGQFMHALERAFETRATPPVFGDLEAWLTFTAAVGAILVNDTALVTHHHDALSEAKGVACSADMVLALDDLRREIGAGGVR